MANPLPRGSSIAVIGAGIIGVSAAYALSERGFKVALFDRAQPGLTGPSWGNAGHVVGSGIFPLAEPGIGWSGLKMLLDPNAPLKVPPPYYAKIAPWLWRFWKASRGAAFEAGLAALIELNKGVVEETEALWGRAGIGHLLKREPALYLYESDETYRLSEGHWRKREEVGLKCPYVDAAGVRELEPHLAPIFPHGVISHEWAIVTDPFEVVTGLFQAAQARGVMHERSEVTALQASGDLVVVSVKGTPRTFDAALVTAGVWSRALAETLGEHLPVEAERGYNLTYPGRSGLINRPLVLADRGVVATGLTPGLRLGGWTELGGIDLPPNAGRWKKMRQISDEVLPVLKGAPAMEWMGHRPSVPDSVPVISRSTKVPGVFYAVGHGHYGLSQSAKTAGMIAAIIGDGADETYAAHGLGRFQ
jgi:D-amino-acid dehydrogenase